MGSNLNVCFLLFSKVISGKLTCLKRHRLNYRLLAVGVSLSAILAWHGLPGNRVVGMLAVFPVTIVETCLHKCCCKGSAPIK